MRGRCAKRRPGGPTFRSHTSSMPSRLIACRGRSGPKVRRHQGDMALRSLQIRHDRKVRTRVESHRFSCGHGFGVLALRWLLLKSCRWESICPSRATRRCTWVSWWPLTWIYGRGSTPKLQVDLGRLLSRFQICILRQGFGVLKENIYSMYSLSHSSRRLGLRSCCMQGHKLTMHRAIAPAEHQPERQKTDPPAQTHVHKCHHEP